MKDVAIPASFDTLSPMRKHLIGRASWLANHVMQSYINIIMCSSSSPSGGRAQRFGQASCSGEVQSETPSWPSAGHKGGWKLSKGDISYIYIYITYCNYIQRHELKQHPYIYIYAFEFAELNVHESTHSYRCVVVSRQACACVQCTHSKLCLAGPCGAVTSGAA